MSDLDAMVTLEWPWDKGDFYFRKGDLEPFLWQYIIGPHREVVEGATYQLWKPTPPSPTKSE